jgi:hypothetical protein
MTFEKLQERLSEEGWFVGWNLPCCQSCAWAEVEHDDLSRVLFNHSQDCEVYMEGEECPTCQGEGYDHDTDDECMECFGSGEIEEGFDISEYDTSVSGFTCNTPKQQSSSYFCFDGTKEGVENLKAILPIIKECGCDYHWDETGNTRIEISWKI